MSSDRHGENVDRVDALLILLTPKTRTEAFFYGVIFTLFLVVASSVLTDLFGRPELFTP